MIRSKVGKNIFYMTFVQIANYIAPLVILPYLARVIGINGVGSVAIALSVVSLGMVLTDFGFAISSPAWIAQNNTNIKKISNYISGVVYVKFLLIFIFILLYLLYVIVFQNTTFGIEGNVLLIAIVFFQGFQMPWVFQGMEKMKNITICTLVAKLSYLLLVILFVKKINGVNTTLLCFLISNILATVSGLLLMRREGIRLKCFSMVLSRKLFYDNIYFFFSRVAVSIYTNASTFIVGSFAGVHQAALYSSAEKLYTGGVSLSAPVSQALYPHLAKTKDIKLLIRLVIIATPLMLLGGGICIYYARDIMSLIYGADFAGADKLLRIFIITAVVSIISINFGYPAFSTVNRLDIVNKSVILGGGLQLISLGILFIAGKINAFNVVLSILFVETAVLLFRLFTFFIINKRKRK